MSNVEDLENVEELDEYLLDRIKSYIATGRLQFTYDQGIGGIHISVDGVSFFRAEINNKSQYMLDLEDRINVMEDRINNLMNVPNSIMIGNQPNITLQGNNTCDNMTLY